MRRARGRRGARPPPLPSISELEAEVLHAAGGAEHLGTHGRLEARMEAEMREMAALVEAQDKSQHQSLHQAMSDTSAELEAMQNQSRQAPVGARPSSEHAAAAQHTEATAVAILQQQVSNVRRVVSENSQKDHQIGILRTRMEIMRSENTEEKENTQRAQQREVQMAAAVEQERLEAEEAREHKGSDTTSTVQDWSPGRG